MFWTIQLRQEWFQLENILVGICTGNFQTCASWYLKFKFQHFVHNSKEQKNSSWKISLNKVK